MSARGLRVHAESLPESLASAASEIVATSKRVGASGLPQMWDDETDPSTRVLMAAAVRTAAKPRLTFMTGDRAGEVFSLGDHEELTIGRALEVDLRIDDSAVSRKHCRIVRQGASFVLEDLKSNNGTWVNGMVAERIEIRIGDRIQLGPNVVMQFGSSDETEATLQKRLYNSSTRDGLTGTYNRHFLFERVASEIAHAQRHKHSLSLMLVDIDHFKGVNDTLGHAMGDAVLREVARSLSVAVRSDDVVARYGGEEFAILVKACSLSETVKFAERLRERVAALRMIGGESFVHVTISVGVAEITECLSAPGASVQEALFGLADRRLYRAKHLGRDRVCAD